jgi:N-acetylglutamate synthase-like GNAT family acetyltransferase
MIGFTIREARREDCKEIRRLIQELADFEKMPDERKIDENGTGKLFTIPRGPSS